MPLYFMYMPWPVTCSSHSITYTRLHDNALRAFHDLLPTVEPNIRPVLCGKVQYAKRSSGQVKLRVFFL